MNFRYLCTILCAILCTIGLIAAACSTSAVSGDSRPAAQTLQTILEQGRIRLIVHGAPLPMLRRSGLPPAEMRLLGRELADHLGVEAQVVEVDSAADLAPALRANEGDVIIQRFSVTSTRKERLAFTRPVRVVSELLLGRDGPITRDDLAGRTVHVRAGSAHVETLQQLDVTPPVEVVEEDVAFETLAHRVAKGECALTVIDSDRWASVRRYLPSAKPLLTLRRDVEVAWVVRQEDRALRAAIDDFLDRRGVLARRQALFTGDLEGIRDRGVLRVLTRNDEISYFVHRGRRYGLDYELVRLIAEDLDVQIEMVVPPKRDQLVPWLLQGRGDVIAASFSVTDRRRERVAFTRPYLETEGVIVGLASSEDPPRSPLELSGHAIHVAAGSSHLASLDALGSEFGPYEVVVAPAHLGPSSLLDSVWRGEVSLTVSGRHRLRAKQTYRPDLTELFALPEPETGGPEPQLIAFAVRPESAELKAYLDGWLSRARGSSDFNTVVRRYLRRRQRMSVRTREATRASGVLSPYDRLLKRVGQKYGMDWRLLAAQAFVESRFDAKAKSWAGAVGLFQIMPRTAKQLGYSNLEDPAVSAHAGARYLKRLVDRFGDDLPYDVRVHFALAAYNVGYGHVLDARRLAEKLDLDPNRWFGHVEHAMRLLAQPRYARQARYGYCRGGQPVAYVRRIQSLYEAYTDVVRG